MVTVDRKFSFNHGVKLRKLLVSLYQNKDTHNKI